MGGVEACKKIKVGDIKNSARAEFLVKFLA